MARKSAALTKVEKQVVAVQQITRNDLMNPEAVEDLVKTAVEVNNQAKAFADQKSLLVKKAKSLYAPEIEEERKVTLYGFESEAKLSISYSGGGTEISDEGVYNSLCAAMGCDPENPTKNLLDLWKSITVPQPRVLDEEKLVNVLANNELVRKAVDDNTTRKAPTVRASISKMTKNEKIAHDNDDLTENVVIG